LKEFCYGKEFEFMDFNSKYVWRGQNLDDDYVLNRGEPYLTAI